MSTIEQGRVLDSEGQSAPAVGASEVEGMVSVIVPCYKQAHYLVDCIGSLQSQGYSNWEAIIVNDGSPDNTREVAQSLQASDLRIRYFETENLGVSSARNIALKQAIGEFIHFLDADDLIPPSKLETAVQALNNNENISVVFGDYLFLDPSGNLYSNCFTSPTFKSRDPLLEIIICWEVELSIPMNSFLFRTSLWRKPGMIFDEKLKNHVDWDLWVRIFRERPGISRIPGITAVYRVNPTSMTKHTTAMQLGFLAAIDKHLADPELSDELRHAFFIKRTITLHAFGMGWRGEFERMLNRNWLAKRLHWRILDLLRRGLALDFQPRYEAIKRKHIGG